MQFLDKALKSVLVAGFAAAFAFSVGLVAQPTTAHALSLGDNFSIDETCDGSGFCSEAGSTDVDGDPNADLIDRISFNYAAVVEQEVTGGTPLDGDDIFFEIGFIDYNEYVDDADQNVTPNFLGADYDFYAIFDASGTAGVNASGELEVVFTSFTFEIYMDDNVDTTLALPDPGAVAPLNDATSDLGDKTNVILANTGDDTLIATATLLDIGQAFLRNELANGDFQVILTDFALSLFGGDFFFSPDPFYQIVNLTGNTDNFCDTSSPANECTEVDGSNEFFGDAVGQGAMFFTAIPEPSTLGLFGIGLIAFGFVMTRRQRRSVAFTG